MLLNQFIKPKATLLGSVITVAALLLSPEAFAECTPYGGCYNSSVQTYGTGVQTYPNNQVYGSTGQVIVQPGYGYGQPMYGQQTYVMPYGASPYGVAPYGTNAYGYASPYQNGYDPYYDQSQYGYSPYGYGVSPLNYYGGALVNSLLGKILGR